MQKETKFKKQVTDHLKARGTKISFTKLQQVSKRGDPDFYICVNGLFFVWELKTDDGKVSELQKFKMTEIDKAGGIVRVVTPTNLLAHLEEIDTCLDYSNATLATHRLVFQSLQPDLTPRSLSRLIPSKLLQNY